MLCRDHFLNRSRNVIAVVFAVVLTRAFFKGFAMKRILFATCALLLACFGIAPVAATAADFPDRPVRLIVPYPTGGSVDFIARLVAMQLSEVWGQTVVVDNRGGASGMIGSSAVAKAKPDGYTLLLGGVQTHAMNSGVIKSMLYDPIKDFTPISQTTRANWVLVASPKRNVKTPAELIALIRAQPGKITFGSSGNGSAAHLAFAMLSSELGIQVVHVPYKGIGQAITDVLSGQVDLVMGDQSTLIPHIAAGKLIPIAMTGNVRSSLLPGVPTLAETISPGFDVQAWQGIWGPPGMDPALVQTINAGIMKSLSSPSLVEKMKASGVDSTPTPVLQFDKFTKSEFDRWTGAARKANISPE